MKDAHDKKYCYYCKKPIPKQDESEKMWWDNNGNYWHVKCGMIDERFT